MAGSIIAHNVTGGQSCGCGAIIGRGGEAGAWPSSKCRFLYRKRQGKGKGRAGTETAVLVGLIVRPYEKL